MSADAHELILHHYPMSPFAEKARLMLGCKRLPWRSVIIPAVMPKPDVVALTGGYRKTPILQVGADVYCDTSLIARVLEARQPQPALYPESAPLAPLLAQWADALLFPAAVSWAMQPAGAAVIMSGQSPQALKAFAADRAAMRANAAPRPTLADAAAQLNAHLAALDAQLRRGGPWLCGAAPSIADFSAGHCLWFIRLAKPVAALLDDYPAIGPWLDRLFAFGHGRPLDLHSREALAVAAAAGAAGEYAPAAVEPGMGLQAGQAVVVSATDHGTDPVAGTLVGLNAAESVLRRHDPRAGIVHVHFPRFGFQLRAEKKD
ncbi:MAG TPA: glutathione S-transferase family protein [Rubrivivax sp.]|nr:glutathione S-transferase family protein [Rubrivivax sp.]